MVEIFQKLAGTLHLEILQGNIGDLINYYSFVFLLSATSLLFMLYQCLFLSMCLSLFLILGKTRKTSKLVHGIYE